jgi:hypothetical protein
MCLLIIFGYVNDVPVHFIDWLLTNIGTIYMNVLVQIMQEIPVCIMMKKLIYNNIADTTTHQNCSIISSI